MAAPQAPPRSWQPRAQCQPPAVPSGAPSKSASPSTACPVVAVALRNTANVSPYISGLPGSMDAGRGWVGSRQPACAGSGGGKRRATRSNHCRPEPPSSPPRLTKHQLGGSHVGDASGVERPNELACGQGRGQRRGRAHVHASGRYDRASVRGPCRASAGGMPPGGGLTCVGEAVEDGRGLGLAFLGAAVGLQVGPKVAATKGHVPAAVRPLALAGHAAALARSGADLWRVHMRTRRSPKRAGAPPAITRMCGPPAPSPSPHVCALAPWMTQMAARAARASVVPRRFMAEEACRLQQLGGWGLHSSTGAGRCQVESESAGRRVRIGPECAIWLIEDCRRARSAAWGDLSPSSQRMPHTTHNERGLPDC